MSFIEITGETGEPSIRQRWSHLLTIIVAVSMFLFGLNLRATALNATTAYTNVSAGITVQYPLNWLVDEEGAYVFRVRDMSRIGFKTTMIVETRPLGSQTTARDIVNTLNINRPRELVAYEPLSIENTAVGEDVNAVILNYTFVDSESNPFLESLPTTILGRDILTIRGNQAIIIRFLADAQIFQNDLRFFNRFLDSLEFQ